MLISNTQANPFIFQKNFRAFLQPPPTAEAVLNTKSRNCGSVFCHSRFFHKRTYDSPLKRYMKFLRAISNFSKHGHGASLQYFPNFCRKGKPDHLIF
jgi:hypothetical protein